MRLENKVAIITGGGSGIGEVTCILFAKEGAKVVVADMAEADGQKTVDKIKEQGGEAVFVKCDVCSTPDVQNMIDFAIKTYGHVDIMINNAGIHTIKGYITDVPEENWHKVMDVDLNGVYRGCKYILPHFMEQKHGVIINTSSVSGLGAGKMMPAYITAKSAVIALTKALAIDFGKFNIRINAICPGVCDTEFMHKLFRVAPDEEKMRADMAALHPQGRMAVPEDIANGMLFLASDEASFVNGIALSVDGGYAASR